MIKQTYKKRSLLHNPHYKLELSRDIVDRWEEASREDELGSMLPDIEKRRAFETPILESGGERFRVKYYRTRTLKRKLDALIFSPESVRSMKTAIRIEKRGVPTPRPLCVWGQWKWGLHEWSVLFTEDLGPIPTLPDFMLGIDPGDSEARKNTSVALARSLARLHDARVYVHDPAKNILVDGAGNDLRFYFIDFDTVVPYRLLTKKRVARVLRHCIRPPGRLGMYDDRERASYVREYLKARGRDGWFEDVFSLV